MIIDHSWKKGKVKSYINCIWFHGRMARGGHRLPKVSLGPAMPNSSMPCRWATPVQGWLAHRADGLRPFYTLLDTPRHNPMYGLTSSTVGRGTLKRRNHLKFAHLNKAVKAKANCFVVSVDIQCPTKNVANRRERDDLLTFWPTELLTYWTFDLLTFWPIDLLTSWPTDLWAVWPSSDLVLTLFWPCFDLVLTCSDLVLTLYWPSSDLVLTSPLH
jgi:hypothetical protein